MIINETKITLKLFCKAFNLEVPVTDDVESFVKNYVAQNNLDWNFVIQKIKNNKEKNSVRRKQRHKELTEELKRADEKFFKEHNACPPKYRNCLRCNTQFYSHNGNRVCIKCHKINQDFIEGFHD